MITALINAQIFTGEEELSGKVILIEDEKIKSIVNPSEIPATAILIDLTGQYVSSGLLDLQIYGAGGKLFGGTPRVEALEQMEQDLLAQGCTGFFATVATNSPQIVEQAIEAAKAYRKKAIGNFLGLHLEGPYLNAKRKGAHPEKYIKKATLKEVQGWIEQGQGEIKMITIAPELQDEEIIHYLHEQGIVISAGHSNATYQEASSFLNNPVQAATHLYNAMPPIHHRDPGLIPAIFEQKPFTSIVADGVHVSFAMIKLAKRELKERLFLITDAVTATDEGIYPHVFKQDRFTMPDGTLSGSSLTMMKAVKNCVDYADISLEEGLRMASLYPATLISNDHKLGKIKSGYQANLVIFDKHLNVNNVLFNGSFNKK